MAFYNIKQTKRSQLKVCSCLDKIRTEHNYIIETLYNELIIHSCLDKIRIEDLIL